MSYTPGRYSTSFVRGDDVRRTLTWYESDYDSATQTGTPVSLTGCTAEIDVRNRLGTLVWSVSTTAGAAGSITLGGAAGTIAIHFDASVTAVDPGDYYYDLQLTLANGDIRTLVSGALTVEPEQTS